MKIQLALDRIDLERAKGIAKEAKDYIDIIEVGTSLIKDYGKKAVSFIKKNFKDKIILADVKTCDEGEYEFIYNAIFFVHLPKDNKYGDLIDNFNRNSDLYKDIKRIALGGGVTEENLKDISIINPEILVVGSAITKSKDIGLSAKEFKKLV